MQLNQPEGAIATKLVSDGQEIKVVDDFKYLGSHVGSTVKDISARIALAWVAFAKLKPILKASRPTLKFKMRLFNAAVVSVLLYGCETWVLAEELAKKLGIFARTCYRVVLGITQAESHMTNDELYRITGQRPMREVIKKRQLQFTGHCLRMDSEENTNIYVLYTSNVGTNKQGRPHKTYLDQISEYVSGDKSVKHTAEAIAKLARDKTEWYRVVAPKKLAR